MKASSILIGLVIFILLFTAGGGFLSDVVSRYTTLNDSTGITLQDFNQSQNEYLSDINSTAYSMSGDLRSSENSSGVAKAFEVGWDFLTNTWTIMSNMFSMYDTSKSVTGTITKKLMLPPIVMFSIIIISVIIITFAVFNALRRWNG